MVELVQAERAGRTRDDRQPKLERVTWAGVLTEGANSDEDSSGDGDGEGDSSDRLASRSRLEDGLARAVGAESDVVG